MRDEPWLEDAVAELLAGCGRGLAVDIGANHGTWSAMLKPLFESVIAVEPDERCPEIYGTKFFRCLIGRTTGFSTLWLSDRPEQNHAAQLHPLHQSGGQPVQKAQLSLEDLCSSRIPDFVKIDVEGAEDEILAGVRHPERFARTAFLIESHAREKELSQTLESWARPHRIVRHPDNCPDHCWFSVPAQQP